MEKTQPRFIGTSSGMQRAYHIINNAAPSTAPVMITGETGTGKELAAMEIHRKSPRGHKDMIILNCAAIPRELLESEIFGHVKGAFTGATTDRTGAALLAHNGTLFLDEISEMPIEIQAKLLRFVQTGIFSPVGSRQTITADIRFISATNRPAEEAIKKGFLREDLYYRLSVVTLPLPPLRARGDDILMLAKNFLHEASTQEKKSFSSLSQGAQGLLMQHAWPGNVRELENTIRRAVIMNDGDILTPDMLDFPQQAGAATASTPSPPVLKPLADIERMAIEQAIALCDGNITTAARQLQINPSTIHRKQREWGKA